MLNPRKLLAAALFVGLGVVLSACEELGEEGGGGLDFGTAGTTTVAITMKLSHFDEPVVIEAPEVKPAETPISVAARSVPTPTPVIAPIPSPTPSRAAAAVRGTATVAPAKVPVPTPAPATPAPTPASVAVPAPIQPPSGLVSWWPGDGNADDVAGGNHGTLVNGATFAPGIVGQAFSLDGADDYVEIGDISDFEITPTTSMSITGWVKTSANGPAMVVTKMDVFSPDFGWLVRVTFQGVLELQIANNDDRVRITTIAVNDDQWHHFAATHNGSTGNVNLYVDSVLRGSTTESFGAIDDGGMPLRIGMGSQGVEPFPGLIDEVRIYNRALSAEEIKALYDAVTTTSG